MGQKEINILSHKQEVRNTVEASTDRDSGENCDVEVKAPLKKGRSPHVDNRKSYRIKYDMLRSNFINDLFHNTTAHYPLVGFYEVLTHRVYWKFILLSAISYIITFNVIAILYYIFLFPTTAILYLFLLGPFGPVLAVIDLILHSNSLAKSFCKHIILTRVRDNIFDLTLERKGCYDIIKSAKLLKKNPNADATVKNWRQLNKYKDILIFTKDLTYKIIIYFILFLISLFPIIGPLVVNFLVSPERAHGYLMRYFVLNNDDKKTSKKYRNAHLANFLCFGMMAGLLEFLPGSSIITFTTNTVAGALWAENIIKKQN
ncbi:hypothetical protein TPHA_0L00470 [Tetrapisispora phaffii CBS 4417]|uniref:Outer spore wall protein RRT8 n=1 Tax=Tetrapisispora phaffii (strain ATCC 24235 / CBS 4417 / NBRC 1672 / NRRL Y-8282 / UCD 70-5) TaxID=1071381 RepID=G8BZS5_TETPH|nr:hypothetical protein TPHA_0L00470 [Tetrapisispora phaffii CBS 4417]CCE65403.1 hypothetical protein TPHA_0L00470 [Tetrapisispora phaffii CBS 4417]